MLKKVFGLLLVPILGLTLFGGSAFAVQQINNPYLIEDDGGETKDLRVIGSGTGQKDAFINVVKGAINWVLAVLALIALIILLYGGFMMVTASGNEDKYKQGFTILRQAAIGLILIGVARFVISIIFWLVSVVGLDSENQAADSYS